MKHLFCVINTAIEPYTIAFASSEKLLMEEKVSNARGFTESLATVITIYCERLGYSLQDISALGGIIGPGSYTGIRLGVSCMKTLAMALGCPLYGVTTMQAYASQFLFDDEVVGVVCSGKKGRAYLQLFNKVSSNVEEVSNPIDLTIDQFQKLLEEFNCPLRLVGTMESSLIV